MDPTLTVPGSGGLTVGDLQNAGWSSGEIQTLWDQQTNPATAIGLDMTGSSPTSGTTGSSSSSSWLSGIAGIGSAITNVFRAINPPKAGTTLYNPATGLPYGVNPATGLPYPQAQTQSLGTLLIFVVMAFVLIKLLK